jgi:peptidoglycan/LPS O-acetylase OafA/YrhL
MINVHSTPSPHGHSASSHGGHYRADIDGLRAIAVMLVVAFHAFPNLLPGGYVGVDVFFVISGFLISKIIFGALHSNSFSIGEFYARRVKRIFPALSVVLTSVLTVGWFTLLADEYMQLGKHVAGGTAFISNFVLLSEMGYFDTSSETKPLLHLWSLGIEEQFYIFYPIALWAVTRRRLGIITLIAGLGLVSFAANVFFIHSHRDYVFYLPFTRMWELLLGAALAYRCTSAPLKPTARHSLLAWIGLFCVIGAAFVLDGKSSFPGLNALLPVTGTALVLWAGQHAALNRLVLSNTMLVGIGLVSYPLYLWHWPLLSFGRILGYNSHIERAGSVLASLILAALTYLLVERPVRFRARGKGTVLILVVAMLIVGSVGFSIYQMRGLPYRDAHRKYGINPDQLLIQPSQAPDYGCPEVLKSADAHLGYCRTSSSAPPTMALLGDSHADDKYHGLAKLDPTRSWILLGNNSCPPLQGTEVQTDHANCKERIAAAVRYLSDSTTITTVVLSFFEAAVLDTPFAAEHVSLNRGPHRVVLKSSLHPEFTKQQAFEEGLEATVRTLQKAGKKVVVLIDVPELSFIPRDCIRDPSACVLPIETIAERQKTFRKIIEDVKDRNPGLLVYDPLPILSRRGRCLYTFDGNLIYRDSHHVSEWGSEYLAKDFLQWLSEH